MYGNSNIFFQSFSSGSAGNCYYLGGSWGGIMIDAGVSVRRLKTSLLQGGLTPEAVQAVLVTHDHWDHIHNLGSVCKRMQKPVYLTGTLRKALAIHYLTGEYLAPVAKILEEDTPTWVVPGHVCVSAFVVPHDATQTLGYYIEIDGYPFAIMTDIGRMTPQGLEAAKKARTVVVESNYDADMLRLGGYPKDLQDRIRGGHGHLSNAECAEAIGEFLHEGLDNVFLCHLSANNNTPALALESAKVPLEGSGVRLIALPRTSPSALFRL